MLFPTALHYTFVNSWNTTISFFSHNSVSFYFCKSGVCTKVVVWITLQFIVPHLRISSSWRLEPLSFSSDLPHTSRKVWGEAWIHFKNFQCKCALSSCASHLRCMHWRPARVENFCPFLSSTSKLLTRTRRFWSNAGNLAFFAAKQEKLCHFQKRCGRKYLVWSFSLLWVFLKTWLNFHLL